VCENYCKTSVVHQNGVLSWLVCTHFVKILWQRCLSTVLPDVMKLKRWKKNVKNTKRFIQSQCTNQQNQHTHTHTLSLSHTHTPASQNLLNADQSKACAHLLIAWDNIVDCLKDSLTMGPMDKVNQLSLHAVCALCLPYTIYLYVPAFGCW